MQEAVGLLTDEHELDHWFKRILNQGKECSDRLTMYDPNCKSNEGGEILFFHLFLEKFVTQRLCFEQVQYILNLSNYSKHYTQFRDDYQKIEFSSDNGVIYMTHDDRKSNQAYIEMGKCATK